ncbi:hypothetical protein TWF694_008756 [Orbilia ellipsospora]|uniref:Large ribosomal subunit protein mL50 n=1 Tax=Orbilia ellipsospora TaxID=2528407 RepID=A0AAV9XE37_9PEZI
MNSLTARLSRALFTDLPQATLIPSRRIILTRRRTLHTTPATLKSEDDDKLTAPQQWKKMIWGEAGPADPYKELTPEEREQREIQLLEMEDAKKAQKKAAQTRTEKMKSAAELKETYVPDTDARSMLVVGTRGAFMKKHWDSEHRVWRYLLKRLSNPEEITAAVRRAVVETYTLAITRSKPTAACQWYRGPEYLTSRVRITKTEDEKDFAFDYRTSEIMQRIQDYAVLKQPLPADKVLVESTPVAEGDEWLDMTLGGTSLKFAVVKRSMQLTGLPLTDPVINSITKVGQLVAQFHRIAAHGDRERLAEKLTEDQELTDLPNVSLHPYQLRFTDKERAIGRLETIPIMMAGRLRKEGELIGKGAAKGGRTRVSRSMMRLRARKMRGWGVTGVESYPPIV